MGVAGLLPGRLWAKAGVTLCRSRQILAGPTSLERAKRLRPTPSSATPSPPDPQRRRGGDGKRDG